MAKILVADDNSNVQKTVTLALADLGIEVVAVNNGEAAVRKLADVWPDLVLADIFMPVRNGYEVCEYVKKDSRFANVPVVLLVGAFDPLDEREAQRVGADGILKKPFVPPDPLISMVKMLLDRKLGERPAAAEVAAKPAAVVAARSKSGGVAIAEKPPSSTQISEQVPEEEEFRPPVERLSFGDGARPMAFGQLLDTPVEEAPAPGAGLIDPVPDEQILTSARDASLGDPIFWKSEEPAPENPDENSEAAEAPEQDLTAELPLRPWKPDEEATARNAEAEQLQPVEPLELVREQNHDAAGETSAVVEPEPILVQDAAAQASLTVEAGKPEDLAANPLEWMASVPPPPAEEIPEPSAEWNAVASEVSENIEHLEQNEVSQLEPVVEAAAPEPEVEAIAPAVIEEPVQAATPEPLSAAPEELPEAASGAPENSVAESTESASAAGIPDPEKTHPSLKPLGQNAEETARSISKQDWADLTATLQPPSAEKVEEQTEKAEVEVPAAALEPAALPEPETAPAQSESLASKLFSQNTEDSARSISKRDWAALAASLQPKRADAGVENASSSPAAQESSASEPDANPFSALASAAQSAVADVQSSSSDSDSAGSPDPVLVEAVVQRILEKWRPQVVDIITKEFLRPIVQALVQREIQKH